MPERVDYGVRNRRRRTHRCRLSDALRAEGMVRRGRGGLVGLPVRGLERRGHVVVYEAAARDVALVVVADLLVQRGADPLREAAVDLALDDHRIDDVAAVVDRDEAPDFHVARAAVDVHHADVTAEGESQVGRIVIVRRLQPRLHALRMVGVRRERALLDGLRHLGRALDEEFPGLPVEILLAHFEKVRRDFLCLVADLARGERAGRARGRRRAARVGAEAVRRGVRVALLHLHVRGGNAQFFGDDLGVGRLVPLPLALGAEARDRLAGRVHAYLGRVEHLDAEDVEVPRRTGADDLGEARNANAHQLAFLALFGLLAAQCIVADDVHRFLQRHAVIAAVVLPAEHRLVGELLGLDEVLHAEFRRIHVELLRERVGGALDRVHGFRDAERAPVRNAPRRLVRVGGIDFAERVLQVVGAGADRKQARREFGGIRRGVGVAVVGYGFDHERGHRAVFLRAELDFHVVIAREGIRLQVLHAVLDPLHGLADNDRGRDRDHVARVDGHFAAEAAADVGGHDADSLLRQPDVARNQREHRAHGVRRLRGHVYGELALRGVEVGDAAAGLHRGDVDAREIDVFARNNVGCGERAFGIRLVARLPVEGEVVFLVLLVLAQYRRAGRKRLVRIDHHRQGLVFDLDRVDAV